MINHMLVTHNTHTLRYFTSEGNGSVGYMFVRQLLRGSVKQQSNPHDAKVTACDLTYTCKW